MQRTATDNAVRLREIHKRSDQPTCKQTEPARLIRKLPLRDINAKETDKVGLQPRRTVSTLSGPVSRAQHTVFI